MVLFQLSATDEAWRLLASYLDSYPTTNAQYHHCIIHKLLSHGVPLPDWLVKSYKVRDIYDPTLSFTHCVILTLATGWQCLVRMQIQHKGILSLL